MACCLVSAKPLSEPILPYCQSDPKEHISVKFYLKFEIFHSRKQTWQCHLENDSHFFSASMCQWKTAVSLMCYQCRYHSLALIHCGLVMPHGIRDLYQHWYKECFVASWHQAIALKNTSTYWQQNLPAKHKLQWNFNRNCNIFIHKNVFENVVFKIMAILFIPQCVKAIGMYFITMNTHLYVSFSNDYLAC